jgi:DNA helicase-2/ATP-dependent DNA helicase PcrA
MPETKLDEDQKKIVSLREGYYAVMAGAGSGKSTVLLHRTGELYGQGTVLCVTFTSEASKSLRNRIAKLYPSTDVSVFSTLHSLALRFAYQHPEAFPFKLNNNILAEDGVAAKLVYESIGDKINYRAFTSWVSLQKRNRISAEEALRTAEETNVNLDYAEGYKKYEAAKKKAGVLDFDDLIYYMVEILETRPDIRSKWQYDWVMMDEAQDACELDWRMLQLITEKNKNLMCVGDAGQALFGFRGGVARHFLQMEELFPSTTKLYLGNNYRSTQTIVDFGKKAYPYPEISESFRAVRELSGIPPTITPYSTSTREAVQVVEKVAWYPPDQCAILARTNLALRPFEEVLLDAGIEYYILGDSGFWESPEVKNVLYWIRCVTSPTDNAIIGAIRTPFWPTKYLKRKAVIDKLKLRISRGESAYEATRHLPELTQFRSVISQFYSYRYLPTETAVKGILSTLKVLDHYLGEENINPDRDPIANLKELANASKRYGNLAEFLDFIRRLTYVQKNRKGVCLSTIHSAKGKEWPHVFLVSANDGVLPHSKSGDINEERACFFVGVSRAQETLDISYYGLKSRFLEEIESRIYGDEGAGSTSPEIPETRQDLPDVHRGLQLSLW